MGILLPCTAVISTIATGPAALRECHSAGGTGNIPRFGPESKFALPLLSSGMACAASGAARRGRGVHVLVLLEAKSVAAGE